MKVIAMVQFLALLSLSISTTANAQLFGPHNVIATNADGARDVHAADLDGDGDVDVLSASQFDSKIAWYENDGTGNFGPDQILSTSANGAQDLHAADLDGDGDMDVLFAASSVPMKRVAWFQNDGTGGFGPEIVISNTINSARSIHASDLDGDGDLDVLIAGSNDDFDVAWYENDGTGAFGDVQVISVLHNGPSSVYASDLDGDGDKDVIACSFDDFMVAWYENDGSGDFGPQQVITLMAHDASSVYAEDLDGDGDMDVLSASSFDDKVAWYENDGNGGFGQQQVISLLTDAVNTVHASDLDGDGDIDVLSAGMQQVAWYENEGSGVFGVHQLITDNIEWPISVFSSDLDGDGDMDVLSASRSDDMIAWYENMGINVSVEERETNRPVLYPNPMVHIATLVVPQAIGEVSIEIFDQKGSCVRKETTVLRSGQIQIEREDLPTGSYVLRISSATVREEITVRVE